MLTFKEALEQIMSQDDETKAIIEEALLEVAEEMGIVKDMDDSDVVSTEKWLLPLFVT